MIINTSSVNFINIVIIVIYSTITICVIVVLCPISFPSIINTTISVSIVLCIVLY